MAGVSESVSASGTRAGVNGGVGAAPSSGPGLTLAVVAVQIAAAGAYAAWMAFGDAADAFSLGNWIWMLVPPVVFGGLFCLGLFLARVAKPSLWRMILSGLGCLVSMCGLVVTVVLLPLSLFGSFMDYTIG